MAPTFNAKIARSDAYLSEVVREVQSMRASGAMAMERRSFFKLAGAGAAGLVLGFHLPSSAFAAAAKAGAAPDTKDQAINAFVRIAPDNSITIYSKSPEMGQGIKTAFGVIIADELDADWKHVTVEQAPIDAKAYGQQTAGGSTSIPKGWNQMRQAGAGAKAMLIAAAAKKWNVPAEEITAKDSVLTHAASGKTATYGSLAQAAAKVPMPDPKSLKFKKKNEYRLIGKRHGGVDDPKIVTGQPLYGIDTQLPGMVYASYTKCPAVGGTVKSFNQDEIKAIPGVIDVFALEGTGLPAEVLPGVAIIAKDTWTAFRAKQQLKVVWDESQASKDSTTQFAAKVKKLTASFPVPKKKKKYDADIGDVDKALSAASKTVEAYYEYPFLAHATLEPMNATAHWHDGIMEVWIPSQQPDKGLTLLTTLLKLKPENVVVHETRVGGAFGRRLANDYTAEAAMIAQKVNGPVKLTWMREDDFTHDFFRPAGYHKIKAGLDKDGKLDAWQEHFITFTADGKKPSNSAGYSSNLKLTTNAPNLRRAITMMPLMIPTGSMRAPQDNGQVFVQQSFLHELSLAAGRDHVQFLKDVALRNVPELAVTDHKAVNYDPARAVGVIDLCAQKAGWGKTLPDGHAIGFAWCYAHSGHVAQAVEISVAANKRITVHRIVVATDIGTIVDMAGAESQAQGACIDALSSAMGLKIEIEKGRIRQQNYNSYPTLRMPFAPKLVEAHFLQTAHPLTGMGEPAIPAIAAALGNAIFTATGERVRSLPLRDLGYSI